MTNTATGTARLPRLVVDCAIENAPRIPRTPPNTTQTKVTGAVLKLPPPARKAIQPANIIQTGTLMASQIALPTAAISAVVTMLRIATFIPSSDPTACAPSGLHECKPEEAQRPVLTDMFFLASE